MYETTNYCRVQQKKSSFGIENSWFEIRKYVKAEPLATIVIEVILGSISVSFFNQKNNDSRIVIFLVAKGLKVA